MILLRHTRDCCFILIRSVFNHLKVVFANIIDKISFCYVTSWASWGYLCRLNVVV